MLRRKITLRSPALVCYLAAIACFTGVAGADEENLPRLKFFYFDSTRIEWVVSSDKKAFAEHLRGNSVSASLVTSIHAAVRNEEDPDTARAQMAEWIADQREQFQRRNASPTSFQRAEGIVAYLRAHNLSIRRLVEALKERSGASAVELVVIHQTGARDGASFKMKIMLPDSMIDIGRMGFNVDLQSPSAGYVAVIYALGTALYDVEEMIVANRPPEELPQPEPERVVVQKPVTEIEEAIMEFK